jgi:hypothetical protein
VRQTAIPLGGLISALVLPSLALRSAFVFLAACASRRRLRRA